MQDRAPKDMGLGDQIKRWFRGGRSDTRWVPFLDVSGRIIQVPSAAVRPGMIRVRRRGGEETVWALPEVFIESGEVRHPPFDEHVRSYICHIRETFLEHRPLSLDEWEDGFHRDANPLQEITIWSHAAEVYRALGAEDTSPARRKDVYRIIVTCLVASPDTVWQVLELGHLNRREAKRVVRRVYGKHS